MIVVKIDVMIEINRNKDIRHVPATQGAIYTRNHFIDFKCFN